MGQLRAKWRHLLSIVVLLGLSVGLAPQAGFAQETAAPVSIAHGVAAIPSEGGQSAWRVVLDSAKSANETQPVERALGFVLADDAPILITHGDAGTADLVPAQGASFVNEGDFEQRSSLDANAASYYRIALVTPSETDDAANGELVLGGDAFDTPGGTRAIDLQHVSLADGESISVTPGSGPSLVIVLAGSVSTDDGSSLGEGDAAEFADPATLTVDGDAVLAVATIGDEVGLENGPAEETSTEPAAATAVADETEEATNPSGESVMLNVTASDCSNGDPETYEGCVPLEGVQFSLMRMEGNASSETGIVTDESGEVFESATIGSTVTIVYTSGAPEGLVAVPEQIEIEDIQEGEIVNFLFVTPEQKEAMD